MLKSRQEKLASPTLQKTIRQARQLLAGELGLVVMLFLIIIYFSSQSEFFLVERNLLNITRQISINLIVAIGMTCVILTGEIDLSVGSIAALAGIAAAKVIVDTGSIPLGILAGLGTGLAVGLINGTLTVYGKISVVHRHAGHAGHRARPGAVLDRRPTRVAAPGEFRLLRRGLHRALPDLQRDRVRHPADRLRVPAPHQARHLYHVHGRQPRSGAAVGHPDQPLPRRGLPAGGRAQRGRRHVDHIAPALGAAHRRRRHGTQRHCGGHPGRRVAVRRYRHGLRHADRRDDHRGDRQRHEPDRRLALLTADCQRRHHPGRGTRKT